MKPEFINLANEPLGPENREYYIVREIETSRAIDISNLPSGVYQIFITFEDGTTIVKQLAKQ